MISISRLSIACSIRGIFLGAWFSSLLLLSLAGMAFAEHQSVCPKPDELSEFNITPWYPPVEATDIAVVNKEPDLPELKEGAKDPAEISIQNVMVTDGTGESLESRMVNAAADFVVERAKAELVLWIVSDAMKTICDSESCNFFFPNACDAYQYNKHSTYPSLASFLSSFRRDMKNIPAVLLCRYKDDNRGYYLSSVIKSSATGIEPKYLIAGLAENRSIRAGCAREYKEKKAGRQCSLYFTGVLMQGYLSGYNNSTKSKMDWSKFFARFNAKVGDIGADKSKVDIVATGSSERKDAVIRAVVEIHYLIDDLAKNLAALREFKTNKATKIKDVMLYAMQASNDVSALVGKSSQVFLSEEIADKNWRSYNETLVRAINIVFAGESGRYADAMLDLQKLVQEYIESKCSTELLPNYWKYDIEKKDCETFSVFREAVNKEIREINKECKGTVKASADDVTPYYQGLKDRNKAALETLDVVLNYSIDSKEEDIAKINKLSLNIKKKLKDVDADLKEYLDAQDFFYFLIVWKKSLNYCSAITSMQDISKKLNDVEISFGKLVTASASETAKKIRVGKDKDFAKFVKDQKERVRVDKDGLLGIRDRLEKTTVKKADMIAEMNPKMTGLNDIYTMSATVPILTALATSQTKEEMNSVLDEAASPLGGWRIKQERALMFSVSSFVGYQISYERTVTAQHKYAWATGLFAPLGLDISTNAFLGSSTGVLLSVVDFGNLLEGRINHDENVKTTEARLKNIVSPGVYFHYGIPKSPAVLGIGWSYSPSLRTLDINGVEREKGAQRGFLFISIDANLFYFR